MNERLQPILQVRPMGFGDLAAIVEIHCQQFPGSRSTRLGKPFLKKMYRWFILNQPSLAFVAVADEKVLGFVTGSIGGYGRKVFRFAAGEIVWGLLVHPALWFNKRTFSLGTSYLKGLLPAGASATQPVTVAAPAKASLASIAVARTALGHGVGKALVGAFENSARQSGITRLGLSVETENLAARRLYEACDWQIDVQHSDHASVYYLKSL